MTVAKPKLRWFQYSLRTLLVFVTLCAIPCSWLAVKMQQARRQREAAAAIEKLGGAVTWDSQSSGPAWLQSVLGDDFFTHVISVFFDGTLVMDGGIKHLKGLNRFRVLGISYGKVTDAGLENLKGLNQLQLLYLAHTQVTDVGLENLKGLNQLQGLDLYGTQITDAGLENLKGLNKLQELNLNGAEVTDAGLENLKGLDKLRVLNLAQTKVTDTGVQKLQQALPNCRIIR